MKSRMPGMRLALMLAAFACAFAGVPRSVPADEPELVIGMLLAMSGPGITVGREMSQGAMLAVEEIDKAGGVTGRKIRLEIGDHKSGDTKAGVSEMERLVNVYQVPAVLTSYSSPTLGAQVIAEQSGVLLINGGGWSPQLIGKPMLWNTRLTGDTTATATARVAYDDGIRTLCMVYRQDPSGIDPAAVVHKFWEGKGGTIACEERYDLNATNFSAQIAEVRASKPDGMLIFSYGQQNAVLIKQARDYGFSGPIYGIDFLPDNIAAAGKAIEGYKFAIDEFDPNAPDPFTQQFVAAYRARFHEEPDLYAANYFEATYILRDLIAAVAQEGKPITGTNLDAKLRQMRSFPSVYGGKLTFRDNHTVQKPIAVFQIKDMKKVLVKKLTD